MQFGHLCSLFDQYVLFILLIRGQFEKSKLDQRKTALKQQILPCLDLAYEILVKMLLRCIIPLHTYKLKIV